MKIRVGNTQSIRLQFGSFEPGEVSSMIEIEDDVDPNKADETIEMLYDKIEVMIEKDLKKKVAKAYVAYKDIKAKIKEI